MIGVVAMALYLPEMMASFGADPAEAPAWLPLVFIIQYGVLVGICAGAGARLAPRVGLHAPAFEAVLTGADVGGAMRPQWVPGLIGGVVGGAVLVIASTITPEALMEAQTPWSAPLPVRVLYGGITEEVFLRWGVMTALAWMIWRFAQRSQGTPGSGVMWTALIVSAVVFGIGHLPAAVALVGALTADVVAYIILANTAFGLVAGWLYWKRGLESAIIAHMVAHLVAFAVALGIG